MKLFYPNCRTNCSGFTLVEALIVTVLIALIAGIAMPQIGGIRDRTRQAKLENEVRTINSAIDIYLASGGNFAGEKNPQSVVDQLKTIRDSETAKTFVGITGSTIDRRLAVRMATAADSGIPRAIWNPTEHRFDIAARGDGVREFYLNEALAEIDYGAEARSSSTMSYNPESGWIWAYSDRVNPLPLEGSSEIPVAPSAPESALPLPGSTPSLLSPPSINPGGGIFRPGDFPRTVTLANPNDSSTWMLYSVNGSAFMTYSGPFSVDPDSKIRVYATGAPASWINSATVGTWFQAASPELLSTPTIQLSAPEFNESTSAITVSIGNPNPAGLSTLHYAIADAAGSFPPLSSWSPYGGSVTLNANVYPSGFSVRAYAKATDPVNYRDSNESSRAAGANFIFEDPGVTDVLYIIDVSGSMAQPIGTSTRFAIVIDALKQAIGRLRPEARFSVVTFAESIKWADSSLQLKGASAANKQAMLDRVSLFKADGTGTNYEAALQSPFMFTQKPVLTIFLTDGQPTGGGSYDDEVATLAAQGIKVNTIGVDLSDTAKARLDDIATKTHGKSTNFKLN